MAGRGGTKSAVLRAIALVLGLCQRGSSANALTDVQCTPTAPTLDSYYNFRHAVRAVLRDRSLRWSRRTCATPGGAASVLSMLPTATWWLVAKVPSQYAVPSLISWFGTFDEAQRCALRRRVCHCAHTRACCGCCQARYAAVLCRHHPHMGMCTNDSHCSCGRLRPKRLWTPL